LYLYKNGTTVTYGLYEVDGDYYFANWGGIVMTSGRYYVGTTFCDLPAKANYSFGEDGKMLNGVEEVDGQLYLYKNGTTVTYGLYEVDGDYYLANWGGIVMTSGNYYVNTTFCDLPANRNYSFGEDGKMLNGFVEKEDGIYYYENGNTPSPKFIEVDGFYYYVNWGGKLLTSGKHYTPADKLYSEIPMIYEFDELGRVVL
jgi:glucan-binding YG repeat protein